MRIILLGLVLHHRATELIRKLDSRPAIGKSPPHVVVAIFVMSGPPMLRPNIVPRMKVVYSVQRFAKAAERHDNFYDMRKISFGRFEASAASGAWHQAVPSKQRLSVRPITQVFH